MTSKEYRNKEWLEDQYIRDNKSSREIGRICGVSKRTILTWLDKLGIPKHPRGLNRQYRDYDRKKHRDPDWLYHMYVEKELNSREIAEIDGVRRPTILKYLRRNNIEIRPSNPANHAEISDDLFDLLTGLILGDGNFSRPIDIASNFSNSDSFKDYLKWLDEIFSNFGIERMGRLYPTFHENGSISWTFQTLKYYEFGTLYHKFYPDGEKAIPSDFSLTSTNLLFWFLGDGCRQSGENYVNLGVFKLDDSILKKELEKVGISASLQREGNIVNILKESWDDFYNYMSLSEYYENIPESYGYKFPKGGDLDATPHS